MGVKFRAEKSALFYTINEGSLALLQKAERPRRQLPTNRLGR